jgi:hypothetical protein
MLGASKPRLLRQGRGDDREALAILLDQGGVVRQ